MKKEQKIELTIGSKYNIISIGGRDKPLESEGIFEGYISVGSDALGLLIKLSEKHKDMAGKIRIVPIQAILAIDIIDAKPRNTKERDREIPHYVG
ncbi:MAG: hypothetical protein DRN12_02165 [Thermoplasmata archaeon]|nr:MAG: hypothetical protein DRN12_02165 [Thermoplasmata archaeon]